MRKKIVMILLVFAFMVSVFSYQGVNEGSRAIICRENLSFDELVEARRYVSMNLYGDLGWVYTGEFSKLTKKEGELLWKALSKHDIRDNEFYYVTMWCIDGREYKEKNVVGYVNQNKTNFTWKSASSWFRYL